MIFWLVVTPLDHPSKNFPLYWLEKYLCGRAVSDVCFSFSAEDKREDSNSNRSWSYDILHVRWTQIETSLSTIMIIFIYLFIYLFIYFEVWVYSNNSCVSASGVKKKEDAFYIGQKVKINWSWVSFILLF